MDDIYQIANLFAGGGGTTTGILMAAALLGIKINLIAINHSRVAIETHNINYPQVKTYPCDLENVDPRSVVSGGHLDALFGSPDCDHFSNSKGGKPLSKKSRAKSKYILRWIGALDIDRVELENVPEFKNWGPLDPKTMRPVEKRKGEYFYRFIRKLEKAGYKVDWRIINAANFGDAQKRRRLFLQARKDGRISWPEPTHHENGGNMFGAMPRWCAARGIINFDDPGRVLEDGRSLVENTMRRIYQGIDRFGSDNPFLIEYHGTGGALSLDDPLPTQTSRDRFALVRKAGRSTYFRMLTPRELARSMSFPDDYCFCGTLEEQVSQIGNAVAVRTAKAHCAELIRN